MTGALLALACDVRAVTVLIIVLLVTMLLALWRGQSSLLICALMTLAVLALVHHDLAQRWPVARDGERIVAICDVIGLPGYSALGSSFDARCQQQLPRAAAGATWPSLRLRIRSPLVSPARQPQAAERWQWLLELHALRAPLNPGGADVEKQWYRERLQALARIRPSSFTQRLAPAQQGLLHWRSAIVAAIAARVDDRDARALIEALAVGATGEVTREQWRVFAVTGITHLVAISGMHVTAFAIVAIALTRRLWRRLPPRQLQCVDRERFAVPIGLAAAVAYAAFAGMSVPTQRTLVMLLIAAAARLSSRHIGALPLLSLAAIAVLCVDPYAPLAAGFWLSFVAVAVLMALGSAPVPAVRAAVSQAGAASRWGRVRSAWHAARDSARLQSLIVLAMAPLTLALFGSVPLAGLAVNLLAIPLFSIALVPLVLAGMALLPLTALGVDFAAPLWRIAEQLWLVAGPLLQWAADLPEALWRPDVSRGWLIASPLFVLLCLLPWPTGLRIAGVSAMLLPVLAGAHTPLPQGAIQATVLDAGSGLAVIVQTAGHTLLYDTADVHGGEGAAVARTLIPALRAAALTKIDRLVVSTLSTSQVIGAATLTSQFPVADVRSGGRWASAELPAQPCAAGERWSWDAVQFEWLNTGSESPCVLRVLAGQDALLLTGALDAAGESELLRRQRLLRAQAVLVPRHGSSQASSPEFVSALRPSWALVASDGAISAAIEQRWRAVGAQWRSTFDCGALLLQMGGGAGTLVLSPYAAGWHWPWRAACPRGHR